MEILEKKLLTVRENISPYQNQLLNKVLEKLSLMIDEKKSYTYQNVDFFAVHILSKLDNCPMIVCFKTEVGHFQFHLGESAAIIEETIESINKVEFVFPMIISYLASPITETKFYLKEKLVKVTYEYLTANSQGKQSTYKHRSIFKLTLPWQRKNIISKKYDEWLNM